MKRLLQPELLDTLHPADRRARGSRADLRRLNAFMGHVCILTRALRRAFDGGAPRRLVELGAGDGHFLLRLARKPALAGRSAEAVLVDRQDVVAPETRRGFERLGWRVETLTMDIFDWLNCPLPRQCEAMLTNLVLHHFSPDQLAAVFRDSARRTQVFIALEPRRSPLALAFSRMVGCIGCNRVTRHDAPASVRAGFKGAELSALWPKQEGWSLQETRAGLFSHLFVARRAAPGLPLLHHSNPAST